HVTGVQTCALPIFVLFQLLLQGLHGSELFFIPDPEQQFHLYPLIVEVPLEAKEMHLYALSASVHSGIEANVHHAKILLAPEPSPYHIGTIFWDQLIALVDLDRKSV